MGINYVTGIVKEVDSAKRLANVEALIAERSPSEILALTAVAVLSDDPAVRAAALSRLDERDREEGGAANRVIGLLRSWRKEGALMTWPRPMDAAQLSRAAEIEAAHLSRQPLSSAVR